MQPLLLVFEDLHWIDSETQALLDSLVESLPTARLLLLVNYRPEYQHGWGSKTYYTQLRLDPLPPASADAFLQALLGDDPSLAPLTQLLIARTEGNPFFLEESVRTLVETGVLVGEPGAYRLAQALPTIQVPATVQAVLAARIDRLPPEDKRLLQTAAVIGTEVPLPLLQAIAEVPEDALHRGLAHLQAAEFLYETRLFPEREYTFKHALTHEVAYSSLLLERRRALHARIVEALEALAPDRVAEQVERLAHHALRGEVWDKAVTYCQQAGEPGPLTARRTARPWPTSSRPSRPSRTCPRRATPGAGHRSPARFAIGARRHWESTGGVLALLGEAEALARALDDPRRLGQVSSPDRPFTQADGRPRRRHCGGPAGPELAAALGESGVQAPASFRLGQAYMPSATSAGRSSCCGGPWRRQTGSRHASTSAWRILSRRVPGGGSWARSGASPRAGATGRKRFASPRWQAEGPSRSLPTEASAICTSPKGTWRTPSGCSSRASPSAAPPEPQRVAHDRCGPGLCLCAPRAPRGGPRPAGGGDQRKSPHGLAAQSCPLRLMAQRGLSCWRDAARRPGSTRARPLDLARQQKERGHEAMRAAPAWRCLCPRRPPRDRAGRSPLPAGPGPGRGTGHAPAPGPLPPRPRHAVCRDWPAGAGPYRSCRRLSRCTEPWR